MNKKLLSLLFAIPFCATVGCAAKDRVTGVPNTFLKDVDITKKLENMPFTHSWVWKEVDPKNYDAVYLPPIKLAMPSGSWKNSASGWITSEQDYLDEAEKIAEYFRKRIVEEIQQTPSARLGVATSPGPGVVVIEIALTELEFSHPVARAGALAAPIPGTSAALSTVTDPHAAFAARLTDAQTGALIATAADRKFPPTRLLDLNKLTVTSSAREVASNWAVEIADAVQKGRLAEVPTKGRFDWKPW